MNCAVMGNFDGNFSRLAFDVCRVRQIVDLSAAGLVSSPDGKELFLKVDDHVCRVERGRDDRKLGAYFIVLDSWQAFNVEEYQFLFNLEEFPDRVVSGTDAAGRRHLCRRYEPAGGERGETSDGTTTGPQRVDNSPEEMEELREMIVRFRNGEFYEALTTEFSGKLKEIACELIDFRKDLQSKLEPSIVDMAARDIPEASNQLEDINTTLEKSTMKIMDINEALLDIANDGIARLKARLIDSAATEEALEPSDACVQTLLAMRESLSQLPAEAREVLGFVLPGLDEGVALLSETAGWDRAKAVLRAPLSTIADLVGDLGEEEGATRLKALSEELTALMKNGRRAVDEAPPAGEASNGGGGELRKELEAFERIGSLALSMAEPLSFQDLVGQRIQKIIRLVKSMETRIEDLVISFGIKLQKHKEDPSRSFEDLKAEVEEYKSELKGPQNEGQGLDQSAIDELLATL